MPEVSDWGSAFWCDLDMVTGLCYFYESIFAHLSSADAEKSYKMGGWVAGWLEFELRDSSINLKIYSLTICRPMFQNLALYIKFNPVN